MHQCFGAMYAHVDALDVCFIRAQNHYMKQMMLPMEKIRHTVQSRVVHTRVDNDSAVVQSQAIAESRHAQEGCDLGRGVGRGLRVGILVGFGMIASPVQKWVKLTQFLGFRSRTTDRRQVS